MSLSRVIRLLSLALIGAALVCLPATTASSAAPADDRPTVNILAAGDSITQGRDGDWTWRYLLWKKFQSTGSAQTINYVGSRNDLVHGGTSYREVQPGFSKRHYALHGRTFKQGMTGLKAELSKGTPNPDVVVVEYGTNDLGEWGQSVKTTLADAKKYVDAVRDSVPGAKIILVEAMNVRHQGAFNAGLQAIATENNKDSGKPRIAVAEASRGWSVSSDTWDHDHHPNPSGDAKIANAVDVALGELGYGGGAGSISTKLPWNPSAGMKVSYSTATRKATVSWDRARADATSVDVQWKKSTGSWATVPRKTSKSWTSPKLSVGAKYRFQLVLHRAYLRSTPGVPGANYKEITAEKVVTSGTVTWDKNGRGRIGVSCAQACEGWLQVWSDKFGTKKSSVGHYKLRKAGTWGFIEFTGLPAVTTNGAKIRIAQPGKPAVFRDLSLSKTPTANVKVSRNVSSDQWGNGSINVSCVKKCEGWIRIQADEDDSRYRGDKSYAVNYRLAAGKSTAVKLKHIPDTDDAWARIAQSYPTVGANPYYVKVELDQVALPSPVVPNVTTSSALQVDQKGNTQIAVRCKKSCEGWLQIWSDEVGAKASKSEPVRYKVKSGQRIFFPIKKVPAIETVDAAVRISQTKPVIGSQLQFRGLEIRPYISVSKQIKGSGSQATINVACVSTCTGWLQVWSDIAGSAKSDVVKYSVKAGTWMTYPIPNSPTLTDTARVRLALPKSDAWGSPMFIPVR